MESAFRKCTYTKGDFRICAFMKGGLCICDFHICAFMEGGFFVCAYIEALPFTEVHMYIRILIYNIDIVLYTL